MSHRREMPDDFAKVARLIGNAKEIREHYRCANNLLYRWLSECNIVLKDARKLARAVPADFASVAPSLKREELQRHYMVGEKTLLRWIRESGIYPYRGPHVTKPTKPAPADFATFAAGRTRTEIKNHYKASWKVVERWLSESGIEAKTHDYSKNTPPPRFVSTHASGGRGHNIAPTKTYTVHDIAADTMRRNGWPVYRSDERGRANERGKFWRAGMLVLTGDELLARAARYERKAA